MPFGPQSVPAEWPAVLRGRLGRSLGLLRWPAVLFCRSRVRCRLRWGLRAAVFGRSVRIGGRISDFVLATCAAAAREGPCDCSSRRQRPQSRRLVQDINKERASRSRCVRHGHLHSRHPAGALPTCTCRQGTSCWCRRPCRRADPEPDTLPRCRGRPCKGCCRCNRPAAWPRSCWTWSTRTRPKHRCE